MASRGELVKKLPAEPEWLHIKRLANTGSYSVLKKQGFVAEGIVRDKHFFRGKYYDHFLLALLKKDSFE